MYLAVIITYFCDGSKPLWSMNLVEVLKMGMDNAWIPW
jgi:hypothetical protein